ncbi:DUF946 domain-containing protein [Heracleum sosnowskyi]|uniref:DUF946 domain-containing protein n=1 Tax=Heracleum sosnowskyi TaxID=360622 RepID=A0AAD8MSR8_9APIA|nr:DUF946 domain-containing protein [Heracleum sosnowskyi]
MGNCSTSCFTSSNYDQEIQDLPISSVFRFPNPTPAWPTGNGFGSGIIDLEGLQVSQITSFRKIWATYEGGADNLGATFFEPSSVPDGFVMLGCYSQPNNRPLSGWVLVGKDENSRNPPEKGALVRPTDYTLVWSSESMQIRQDGYGYIWLPVPPNGYVAVGYIVTTSKVKPSLDKIRCVRSDLTDESELHDWIWGQDTEISEDGFNVYGLRPRIRGTKAQGVCVGTFIIQNNTTSSSSSLACLKNNNFTTLSSAPNIENVKALLQIYSPKVYLHPDEKYLPCSVNWFFENGALLYKEGDESSPVRIEPNGSDLPQGGSNDDEYWLDLPIDHAAKERVKKGDLQSSEAYIHIKPMLGATFTDLAIWIFYSFNGPTTAKLGLVDVPLGRIGEHVGDWEHLTLRISNFSGVLDRVFFSQHSGGTWIDSSLLEYDNGTNKPVAYSSLNGHALYYKPGLVLQGNELVGIRNDTSKSDKVMDVGEKYSIVSDDIRDEVVQPAWLNYNRKWGPKITYQLGKEIEKIQEKLPGELKTLFKSLVNLIPSEVFEEEGPTGSNMKDNWRGDEV